MVAALLFLQTKGSLHSWSYIVKHAGRLNAALMEDNR
jgi:hypothetical protein